MVILETPTFTRQVGALFDEESYRQFQLELVAYPDRGELILLLLAYEKTDRDDLTAEQVRVLGRLVKEEFG